MTDSGCQQCEENSFSGDGASSCTSTTEPCGVPILLTKELFIEIILDFKAL